MSNQPSSKEWEQQVDRKVDVVAEESQLEPALPPPPSLDPSSSSTILPPTSYDSSRNLVATSSPSGDLIASQLSQLFSLVDRLSSENEALKAQVGSQLEAHSSSIARLSTENDFFRRTIEDQGRVIAEISRSAIPEGHWVWETEKDELERLRGKDGRWLFSLEKYKPNPPRKAAGPPTSFLSLPIELTDLIFSLLPRSDVLAVCLVSSGLLQRASSTIYPRKLELFYGSSKMSLFLSLRIVGTGRFSDRISKALLPRTLFLDHGSHPRLRKKKVAFASSLLEGVEDRGQIALHGIILAPDPKDSSSSLRVMLPILAFLNPQVLQIGYFNTPDQGAKRRVPTLFPVTEDELPFLHHWTRLEKFVGVGPSSIPSLPQDGGTLALTECLLEGTTDAKVVAQLVGSTPDPKSLKTVSNTNLVSSLDGTDLPSDPLLVKVYFVANLRAVDQGRD